MLGPRNENARLQSDFYRDQLRKILRWLMVSVVIIYFLLAIIFYHILYRPTQEYYANTTQGKILKMPFAK